MARREISRPRASDVSFRTAACRHQAHRRHLRADRKRRGLMAVRRLNAGLVKIHRSYSIEEAARTLGVHKNTVANWLKHGLSSIDDRRPVLVQGLVLRTFLHERRNRQKTRCAVGQLYCLKCRAPKSPLDGRAVYIPLSSSGGNLKGRCSDCLRIICRRVSIARLHEFSAVLTISYRQAQPCINDRSAPCLECELGDT